MTLEMKMGASERKQKDSATAAYMKSRPGQFPDSVRRPGQGEGAAQRSLATTMGRVENNTSKWHTAMLGGVLAARLGLGDYGIPPDFLSPPRKAA
jgi:hypothetical protein